MLKFSDDKLNANVVEDKNTQLKKGGTNTISKKVTGLAFGDKENCVQQCMPFKNAIIDSFTCQNSSVKDSRKADDVAAYDIFTKYKGLEEASKTAKVVKDSEAATVKVVEESSAVSNATSDDSKFANYWKNIAEKYRVSLSKAMKKNKVLEHKYALLMQEKVLLEKRIETSTEMINILNTIYSDEESSDEGGKEATNVNDEGTNSENPPSQ